MTENNLLEVLAPVGDMERLYAALDLVLMQFILEVRLSE